MGVHRLNCYSISPDVEELGGVCVFIELIVTVFHRTSMNWEECGWFIAYMEC